MAKAAKTLKAGNDEEDLIYVGENAVVERRFTPEVDGSGKTKFDKDGNPIYLWVVYEKVSTGLKLKEGVSPEKELMSAADIETLGDHPVIKDQSGAPIKTTVPFVWVPIGEPVESKEAALESAHAL